MSWNRYYSCSDLRMQYHYMFRTCFGDCHSSILHEPHRLSTRIASGSSPSKTKALKNPREQSIYCYQKTAGKIYYIWHLSLFHKGRHRDIAWKFDPSVHKRLEQILVRSQHPIIPDTLFPRNRSMCQLWRPFLDQWQWPIDMSKYHMIVNEVVQNTHRNGLK